TAVRNQLIGLQTQIRAAETQIETAEDNLSRAKLAASGGTTSSADAQVKQALGVLRAAQANYAKTVLRAPVSGTVNELPVRVGDFIGPQTKVALVANNNALEIVTYASDAELFALQPGDTVTIEGQYEGIITTIAPAVDSATGKTEVRIASENADIKNGDTVRITAAVSVEDVADGTIRVPLTAVKFERADGFMFRVNNSVLEKFPVALGPVFGGEVVIASGLTATDEFVVDARGLREGDSVEVTK
ncbi:efflux RND transporter periplasmic adaptor subunit, partial [Candidatus Kaiserbacteria bacterium]|nr:efflux RND transporter periplasmic adaptor subunit [Candidatus Kaiserbacteria bacterium]